MCFSFSDAAIVQWGLAFVWVPLTNFIEVIVHSSSQDTFSGPNYRPKLMDKGCDKLSFLHFVSVTTFLALQVLQYFCVHLFQYVVLAKEIGRLIWLTFTISYLCLAQCFCFHWPLYKGNSTLYDSQAYSLVPRLNLMYSCDVWRSHLLIGGDCCFITRRIWL